MNELKRQAKPLEESEAIIKSNENFVGMGIWNIGNEFKYIRDNKTYLQKGYSGFSEYIEAELKYERSQAYNFITIAEKYSVQSIGQVAHLGIVKMLELSKFEEPQRKEIINSNPIDEMTTRQLQEVIKAKKQADLKIEELEQKLLLEQKEIEVTKEVIKQVEVPPADYRTTKAELEKLKSDLEMAEFKNQQLKRRMDEDNTPELFQRMAKKESEAQLKIIELNKKIDQMEADSKTIEHKVKKSSITFCGKVHNFLTDVGGLAWINDYADLLDGQERKDYLTALNALEGWLYTIKNTIEGD